MGKCKKDLEFLFCNLGRYRSITKQFFRKADAVVVMYDITNQHTFTAVKSWLANVQVKTQQSVQELARANCKCSFLFDPLYWFSLFVEFFF